MLTANRKSNLLSSITRSKAGKLLLALLFSITATTTSAADEITLIMERMAIAETLAQYSYRWDSKNSREFSELFTDNGIIERSLKGLLVEGSRIQGKQAIYDYAKQSHEGRLADRQTRHHFSGLVFLELTEQTAVTENMALITHQSANDTAAVIRSSGIYRNSWLKTEQGWKISRRILFTDSFPAKEPE